VATVQGSGHTHWDLIADGLLRSLSDEERDALVSIHTESKAGARPFIFKTEGE
jgi:hypothetical protein